MKAYFQSMVKSSATFGPVLPSSLGVGLCLKAALSLLNAVLMYIDTLLKE